MNQQRFELRRLVRFLYDAQRLRIQVSGRLTKKAKDAPVQLEEAAKGTLEVRFQELVDLEERVYDDVEAMLLEIPFYRDTLSNKSKTRALHPEYHGLGVRLASIILAEIDIEKATTVSKVWAFAGLAPTDCHRCKECQVIVRPLSAMTAESPEDDERLFSHPKNIKGVKCKFASEEISSRRVFASSKTMKPTKGKKLPYNAWLRTKLIGVWGPVLLKSGNETFRKFYDDYKHRWESAGKGISKGHRHQAAIRYGVKQMLAIIHTAWRKAEGLSVRPSYQEEKLGHHHEPRDTRYEEVSHPAEDTQMPKASHPSEDTQMPKASHPAEDTQIVEASQVAKVTHSVEARREVPEARTATASQSQSDTHEAEASQRTIAPQSLEAETPPDLDDAMVADFLEDARPQRPRA